MLLSIIVIIAAALATLAVLANINHDVDLKEKKIHLLISGSPQPVDLPEFSYLKWFTDIGWLHLLLAFAGAALVVNYLSGGWAYGVVIAQYLHAFITTMRYSQFPRKPL